MDATGGIIATMLIALVSIVVLLLTHGLCGTNSNGKMLTGAGSKRRCCGGSDKLIGDNGKLMSNNGS